MCLEMKTTVLAKFFRGYLPLGLMLSDYLPLFFKVLENEKWQKPTI